MGTRGRLCIKANKRHGEDLRQFTLHHALYDPSRKPKTSKSHILIPIRRPPTEEEETAARMIAEYEIKGCVLPRARPTQKGLGDLLVDTVPLSLLSDLPKSYDIIGDIIVIENLSEGLMVYKKAIGAALLGIHKSTRSCLLKVGKVEGERRIPTYDVVAGLRKFDTIYHEYGVLLKIDLSKVYFSPRLGNERQRVAATVSEGETVVDMFAGVGPFSLAIAKKVNAAVYSIDINPDAIELLKANVSLNHLRGKIFPICGDASTAARAIKGVADHVIMNLPGSSLKFMDAAVSLLKPSGGLLHIYTFSSDPDVSHTGELVLKALKAHCSLTEIISLRRVKEVAPRKWQIAVDVACKGSVKTGESKAPRRQQS
jgi:tRNA (guanine37-N1)-methyltransferase